MASNVIGVEKLNDDVNDKSTDDEHTTDAVVMNESLPSPSIVESKKKKQKKGVFNKEWLKIDEYKQFLKEYK